MEMASDRRTAIPRRRALRLTAAAGAALTSAPALTGCGGSAGDPSHPTLTLVYQGDASQQKAFQQLFDAFHKAYPHIRIKANGIAARNWATFAQTVSTQIAGGKVPDIVDVATEGQRLFSAKGLLEPLDPYIERDKKVLDDFYADIDPKFEQWTQKYGSPDGKTYFLPGGYNSTVLYCHTEVFRKAGVDLPDDGWTWDEFRAAGLRIKQRTGAFLLPLGYAFPFVDILPWLLTNGASTLDADWKKATFDSPAAIEAASYVKSLIDDGLSPKPGGTFDAAAQLAKGRLATLGGGRWPTLDVRRLGLVDKVRIMPWPVKKGHGSPIGWDGWPILRASRNKDAAWTFLKWLTTKEAAVFYAKIGGTNIPARNSVARGKEFLADAPEGTGQLAEAITYGTPIPSPERGAEADAALTQGWQAAITGTKPVAQALHAANQKLDGLV